MENSSFLPEDYLEQKLQRRTNIFSLTLTIVVMAAVAGAFFYSGRQRTEVRQLQQQVNAQFEDAAKRLEQLEDLQSRKKVMIQKARVIASLLEPVPRTLVLSELINSMPTSLGLLDLHLTSKSIKVAASRPRTRLKSDQAKKKNKLQETPPLETTRVTIELVGVAPTDVQVSDFMANLGANELFTDLNLVFSESITIDDESLRKFGIEMTLCPNMDIQRFEPKLVKRELKQNPMGTTIQIGTDGNLMLPGDTLGLVRDDVDRAGSEN